MHNSLSHRISALPGYAGHVHIDSNFQLLENSTDRSPEVMAELCGVLIGYLKARATAVDPVTSISIVYSNFLFITCHTNGGYLLLQFSRNEDLSNLRDSLSSIIKDMEGEK